MANLNNVMKLSLTQYNNLIAGTSQGGYSYDDNTLYLIDQDTDTAVTWPDYSKRTEISNNTWIMASRPGGIIACSTYGSASSTLIISTRIGTASSTVKDYMCYQEYSGTDGPHATFALFPIPRGLYYKANYGGSCMAYGVEAM